MRNTLVILPACIIGLFLTKNGWSQKQSFPPPPPKVTISKFKAPVINENGKQCREFSKRNPSVRLVWQENNTVVVKLKNGKKEIYTLNDKDQKRKVIEKYGPLPPAIPKVNIARFKPGKIPPPPPPKKED